MKKKTKKALITILGIQGGKVENKKPTIFNFEHKAEYYFENMDEKKPYFNTLPLLMDQYQKEYEIVPIYTDDAKTLNQEVLKRYEDTEGKKYDIDFKEFAYINDEKNIDEIFSTLNHIFSKYDKVIVDVTHGFRHLPLLMMVELIMQHFEENEKIEKILFAKEIEKHTPSNKGLYELIDLKRYVELANISFVLTNFAKNYTVANHIKSEPYSKLITALNDFSEDIMALNLQNLFKESSPVLIKELRNIDDVSIKNMAHKLALEIERLTNYKGKKRYQTYYDLAYDLFEKNYILLSLSLLFESIRLYIKTTIKKEHHQLVAGIEKKLNYNLYKIGDFFKNLKWKSYEKFNIDKKPFDISKEDYNKLKNSFPEHIKDLYDEIDRKRNNLAHANSGKRLKEIRDDVEMLFQKYKKECIDEKNVDDLVAYFA